jgi:hypothetical protein
MTQAPRNSFKRKVRVCYPAGTGTLVLRTDLDWERDIDPVAVSSDGNTATFEIEAQRPFVYFKPCSIKNGSLHWAVGPNHLLIITAEHAAQYIPTSSVIREVTSFP